MNSGRQAIVAIARRVVESQVWLSRRCDRLLPERYRIDGNREFIDDVVPSYLSPNKVVWDVGGGKNPCLSREHKRALGATVVGLDIDAHELGQAPDGVYDETVCSDLAQYSGDGTADLVVCQALLEHVRDVPGAFRAIASILRPDGVALVFVPSRNALYARLNLILPERLKRALLHGIFPNTKRDQGFPAYYDHCTPRDFRRLAAEHGLLVREMRCYYRSSYFSFFFPAYLAWRAWLLLFHTLAGEQAAETFTVVLQKT